MLELSGDDNGGKWDVIDCDEGAVPITYHYIAPHPNNNKHDIP